MSNLSILIPTYNRPTEFKYLISTLVSNLKDVDYEIVILDNNPPSETYVKDTIRLLDKYTEWDTSRINIYKGENCSEIRFRPDLIKLSKGQFLWFIDDDCIIDTFGLSQVDWNFNNPSVIYTLPFNQFYMEKELYSKVYSYNLYDFIFHRDLFNYDEFVTLYSNPTEYKIGGDKEIMKFISFDSTPKVSICKFPVIINLYRRGGDNLMLNN